MIVLIVINGFMQEIWVDRRSGKMCMAISWKGMKITRINDRRCWSHIQSEESRLDQTFNLVFVYGYTSCTLHLHQYIISMTT